MNTPIPGKVSIIFITIDRYELTKKAIDSIISTAGYDNFELVVADNGSSDQRVVEYIKSLNPAHYVLNGCNLGVAATLNQLIAKASGEYICHIGNDIVMSPGWLKTMVDYQEAIPSTGVCAVHTVEALPPLSVIAGKPGHLNKIVFGPKMYRKKLVQELAYKEFSKYGLEDSDLSLRFYYRGYYNYYVNGISGVHLGNDVGEDSAYRKMKNEELAKAGPEFIKSVNEYKKNDISRY